MKKGILPFIIISLLVVTSCTKNTTTYPGGTWSFNSNSYGASSCKVDSTNFTLSAFNTVTGSTYSNIVVYFYDSLPDTGSYTIVTQGNLSAGKQASISVAYETSSVDSYYGSIITSTPATQQQIVQKIKVTKTNGKLGASGSGIFISPTTSPFDTIPLSFSITQTQ